MNNIFLTLFIMMLGVNSCSSQEKSVPKINQPFENYKNWFTQTINLEGINGAAIALIDGEKIIWSDEYGCLDNDDDKSVNSETIFNIQSVSKSITATAVMIAVQKRLIELDKPISDYLPEFTVNSCFEKDPQKKITMRNLLSHTAGFTHEAPVGNNYDAFFPSYEAHIKSISDTWLKFSVGSKYSYSNLGVDIAAYILEKVSKKSFPEFLKEELFERLGMNVTTIEPNVILKNNNRAIGHSYGLSALPAIMPFYGSGAVYTSLNDIVKFVQFHINLGRSENRQLLDKKYLIEMYKPVVINYNDCALGIAFTKEESSYAYTHSGGGFGFGATIKWYPEYKIGVVVLANKDYTNSIYITASRIADDYMKQNKIIIDSASINFNPDEHYRKLENHKSDLSQYKCRGDSIFKSYWGKYIGTYSPIFKGGFEFKWYAKVARFFGFTKQKFVVYKKDDCLYLKNGGDEKLIEPGLFINSEGESLDFRGELPRYRNIQLE